MMQLVLTLCHSGNTFELNILNWGSEPMEKKEKKIWQKYLQKILIYCVNL